MLLFLYVTFRAYREVRGSHWSVSPPGGQKRWFFCQMSGWGGVGWGGMGWDGMKQDETQDKAAIEMLSISQFALNVLCLNAFTVSDSLPEP